jgi:hypothetical protein
VRAECKSQTFAFPLLCLEMSVVSLMRRLASGRVVAAARVQQQACRLARHYWTEHLHAHLAGIAGLCKLFADLIC